MAEILASDGRVQAGAHSVTCYRCNAQVLITEHQWALDLAGDDERCVQAWGLCDCGATISIRTFWNRKPPLRS